MPEINNAEKLREWLRSCTTIASRRYFGVDYVGEKATQYGIVSVPSMLQYRENILGERVLRPTQMQNFILAAEFPYSNDFEQNLSNLGFFQDIANWIQQQNKTGNFPDWDGGTVTAVECSNTGAPVMFGTDSARYQIQIRVTYKIS